MFGLIVFSVLVLSSNVADRFAHLIAAIGDICFNYSLDYFCLSKAMY